MERGDFFAGVLLVAAGFLLQNISFNPAASAPQASLAENVASQLAADYETSLLLPAVHNESFDEGKETVLTTIDSETGEYMAEAVFRLWGEANKTLRSVERMGPMAINEDAQGEKNVYYSPLAVYDAKKLYSEKILKARLTLIRLVEDYYGVSLKEYLEKLASESKTEADTVLYGLGAETSYETLESVANFSRDCPAVAYEISGRTQTPRDYGLDCGKLRAKSLEVLAKIGMEETKKVKEAASTTRTILVSLALQYLYRDEYAPEEFFANLEE